MKIQPRHLIAGTALAGILGVGGMSLAEAQTGSSDDTTTTTTADDSATTADSGGSSQDDGTPARDGNCPDQADTTDSSADSAS
jgi:hypothetical protein